MPEIFLYHGSTNIIQKPLLGVGKIYNDYGQAFYTTPDLELAREWACLDNQGGYVNSYQIELDGLNILDLQSEQYTVLHWLTLLLCNRSFSIKSDIAVEGYRYLMDTFYVDTADVDIVIGYRADDSYFSFASAFLNNAISLGQLSKAMVSGNLGIQYAIRSQKGFESLRFVSVEIVEGEIYYPKRMSRDQKAREAFLQVRSNLDLNGTYLLDIIRNQWRAENVRL